MTRTGSQPAHHGDSDSSKIETEFTADNNYCLNCCRQLSVVCSDGDEDPFGAGVVAFTSFVKNAKTQVFVADAVKEIYSVLYAVDLQKYVEACALCVDCSLIFAQLFGLLQTFESRRKADGFLDIALTKGIEWASDFTKNKTGSLGVVQETDGTDQDDFISEFEKFADRLSSEHKMDSVDADSQGNESADLITVQSVPSPEEPTTDEDQGNQDSEDVNLPCDSDVDDAFPMASPLECDVSDGFDSNEVDSENDAGPSAASKSVDTLPEVNDKSTGNTQSSSKDLKPCPRKSRRIGEYIKTESNITETASDVKVESEESDYAPTASRSESSDDDNDAPPTLVPSRKRAARVTNSRRAHTTKNIMYKCADCNEQFRKPSTLAEHRQNAHDTSEAFKCHICFMNFSNGCSLKAHLIRHAKDVEPLEKEKIFKCIDCGERFAGATEFGRHRIDLHGAVSNLYVCHICLYNSKRSHFLKLHILRHISTEEHKCSECGKIFKVFPDMQDHMFKVHQVVVRKHHNRPFRPAVKVIIRCRKCDAEFDSSEKLFEHSTAQHGSELFHCEICKSIFFSKVTLTDHMHKHGEPKLQCKFCDRKFHTQNQKRHHEMYGHQDVGSTDSRQNFSEAPAQVPGTFHCTECPLAFDNEIELSGHVKCRHKKVDSFVCDVCPKSYVTKERLRMHQRQHHGQNKCLQCNEMIKKGGMAKHLAQSHRKEKPKKKLRVPPKKPPQQRRAPFEYPCSDCPEKFQCIKAFAEHRKTHNVAPEDIYKCIYCLKNSVENKGIAGKFRNHLVLHNESTDWPCAHCSLRFRKRTDRNEHQLQVHGPQPDDDPEGMIPLPPQRTLQFVAGEEVHADVKKSGSPRTAGKKVIFKCVDCDQEFNRPLQLGNHRAVLHGCEPARRFQCHRCLRFSPNVGALYGHMRRHYAEPDQLCHVCSKTFRMSEDLKQHYRLNHTEDEQKVLRLRWKKWRDKKAAEKRAEKLGQH